MKRTLTVTAAAGLAAACITIAAGCGSSDSTGEVPTGADLKGTWTIASSEGFEKGKPATLAADGRIVITQAKGQGFGGYKTYTDAEGGGAPTQVKETINGAIASDGDILYVDDDGFFEGVLKDGVMTGQYTEVGADGTAMNVDYVKK